MPDEEIKVRLGSALDQLFKNDAFLFQAKTNERSVAHKLAGYLQMQFSGWDVDCEYNRHGLEIKRLGGELVYPDIVIHHRGFKENLLVVELKTSGGSNTEDIKKLEKFTAVGEYEYKIGVFLRLQDMSIEEFIWFKNGRQTS